MVLSNLTGFHISPTLHIAVNDHMYFIMAITLSTQIIGVVKQEYMGSVKQIEGMEKTVGNKLMATGLGLHIFGGQYCPCQYLRNLIRIIFI